MAGIFRHCSLLQTSTIGLEIMEWVGIISRGGIRHKNTRGFYSLHCVEGLFESISHTNVDGNGIHNLFGQTMVDALLSRMFALRGKNGEYM